MAATSDGTSQAGIASTSVPPTLLTLATDNLPLAIGFVVLFVIVLYAFALACLRCCVSELNIHSAKTYFWFLAGCCLLPYSCVPRPDDEEAWRVRQAKKLASREMKASRQRQADQERQQTELLRRDFARQQALQRAREMGENRDDIGLTHSSGKKPPVTLFSEQTRPVPSGSLPVPMDRSMPPSAKRFPSPSPRYATKPLAPETEVAEDEEEDHFESGDEQPDTASPKNNPFGPPLQSRKQAARSPAMAGTPDTPRTPRQQQGQRRQRRDSIGASTIFVKKKADIQAKRERHREIRRKQKEQELAEREQALREQEARLEVQRQKERDRKAQEDFERDEIDRENFERLQKAEIEMQQEQEELAERLKEERRKRKEEKERRRELEEEHRAMLEREEELAQELEEKERALFEMEEERRRKEAQKKAKREAMMQMEQSGYYDEGQQAQPQMMHRQQQMSRPMPRPIQRMQQQRQPTYDPRMAQQQQMMRAQAMQQQPQMRMMPQYSQPMMQRPMQAMQQPMMQYPPQQNQMMMPQQYQQFGYR